MSAKKRTYLFITKPEAPWASTEIWVRATTYAKALGEAISYFDDGDLGEDDLDCYILPRDVWHWQKDWVAAAWQEKPAGPLWEMYASSQLLRVGSA